MSNEECEDSIEFAVNDIGIGKITYRVDGENTIDYIIPKEIFIEAYNRYIVQNTENN